MAAVGERRSRAVAKAHRYSGTISHRRTSDARPYEMSVKGERYMKATGIVRRIEECVIIGQKPKKPHKHWGFH